MARSQIPQEKRRELLTDSNLLFLLAVCIFVFMYVVAFVFIGGGFRTFQHFFNIFNDNAALIILACGLSIVMVAGGIDISVGGVTAMIVMACAVYLNTPSVSVWGSLAIALGIGLAFGIAQGFLVAYLDIQPFIITLAGMFLARGMVTVISGEPVRVVHDGFARLANMKLEIAFLGRYAPNGNFIPLKIGLGVMIALAVVIAVAALLKWSRFGRNLYAVGGNKQSALMSGINVRRTKFLSHVVCGLLAGIAGFVCLVNIGAGNVSNAAFFEMKAIAASIIGGTMLTGGVGNVIGSPFGVMTLMTIESIVVISGLTVNRPYLQTITTGAMLCIAILLQSITLTLRRGNSRLRPVLPQWLKLRGK